MMRILYVSPRQSWPATSGAKLRDFHFALALGTRSELTYVYYPEAGLPPLTAGDFPFCHRIVSVPRPRAYSAGRVLKGLFSRWPLPVLNYQSPEMERTVGRLLAESRFDIVHFDATHLAGLTPLVAAARPEPRVVFDWHNVESELMRRYARNARGVLRRWYARSTATRMAEMEHRLLESAAGHVVCSERERLALASMAPSARIWVVENGVDLRSFPSAAPTLKNEARTSLLFVGLMAYHANAEAAVWFVREVWPSVRERFGGKFTLTIVGANPGVEVTALRNEPGVEVTGTVPDVRPFYRDAFAVIVPLRTGGGTRLKIIEAMAAEVPVISTPLGAEGLAVTPGTHFLSAQKPEDWIQALSALEDERVRRSLVAEARRLVEQRYDWDQIGEQLFNAIAGWAA